MLLIFHFDLSRRRGCRCRLIGRISKSLFSRFLRRSFVFPRRNMPQPTNWRARLPKLTIVQIRKHMKNSQTKRKWFFITLSFLFFFLLSCSPWRAVFAHSISLPRSSIYVPRTSGSSHCFHQMWWNGFSLRFGFISFIPLSASDRYCRATLCKWKGAGAREREASRRKHRHKMTKCKNLRSPLWSKHENRQSAQNRSNGHYT